MKKNTNIESMANRTKTLALRTYLMLVILMVSGFNAYSQDNKVVGTVIANSDGLTLPGVNVVVQGTSIGTVTDFDGHFEINVPNDNSILVFTFMGFKDLEEPLNGRKKLDILLMDDVNALSEVVVTALNIQKDKASLGYSISQVGSEEVSQAKENNVMNSLAGKVAGLKVSTSPSGVDGSTKIVLRGASSLTGSNRPLIVIDGVPVGGGSYGNGGGNGRYEEGVDMGDAMSDINPDDVESISVLKGAGASAAYGSRGGNGVILITTKKGKSQKGIGVSLSSSYTVQQPYVYQDMQNEYGQGGFGKYPSDMSSVDAPYNWSWGPKMDGRMVTNHLGEQQAFLPTSNPYKDFYQNGSSFVNTVALNGGNDRSNFRASITNQNSEGIVPNNTLAKQTFNIRGFSKLGDLIELDSKVTYIHHMANDRPYLGEDAGSAAYAFKTMPRNISTDILKNNHTDANGNQIWHWDNTSGNPYWALENKKNWDERHRLQAFLSLKFNISEKLSLVTRSGLDFTNRITNYYGARGHNRIKGGLGEYAHNWGNSIEWNTDALLSYKAIKSDDFKMDFNLGGNYRYTQGKSIHQGGTGWKVPDFYKVQNLETVYTREGFGEKEVWSSYFLSNMQFKNYLYFDFTLRNDVSSTIPTEGDANSYMYHSENISLLFSELLNINSNILSSGKLRGSYALVGNDTGPYQTNNYYGISTIPLPYPMAISPHHLSFYDLKPEMTYSWEIGTNLKFFNNRLEADFTYYTARTENQIMSVELAPSTGYGNRKYNAGEVENKGFELQLTGSILSPSNELSWNTTLNASKNASKVLSLNEGKESLRFGTVPVEFVYIEARIGQPFGQIYGYDFARDANGNKLVDNLGYPIATDEMVALGDINADIMLGLSNNLSYKGINLSFLIDAQIGGEYYSQSAVYGDFFGTGANSLEGREEWYSTHDGPTNGDEIPGVFPDGYIQEGVNVETGMVNTKPVDPMLRAAEVAFFRKIMGDYIMDATNVRLREVVLAYQLPQKWLNSTFISRASVSLVGRNLLFFYNANPGIDPESGVNNQNIGTAIELNSMPGTRSFGFNIKLNF